MKNDREKIDKKEIELILRLDKNWRADKVKIERAGGQTNRNYIVEFEKKKYFVRLPWERADVIDRKVEAKNILALVKCKKLSKILPKYHLYILGGRNILSSQKEKFNLPDGTMMTEYITGKDINGEDLARPEIQKSLLKTLSIFHGSGVKFFNNYDVFRAEIYKYKNKVKKYRIGKLVPGKELNKIEEIENRAKRNFPLGGKVSTHNDLIFENLRLGKNGKICLLDFVYGGFNIRQGIYYDLGIILGGNLFQKNPIRIETFEEILEKAKKIYKNKLDRNKIYLGALINVLVMFWWGIVKYFSSITKEEKKYFKVYLLKRARGVQLLYKIIKRK